jgi:hypothetical protein
MYGLGNHTHWTSLVGEGQKPVELITTARMSTVSQNPYIPLRFELYINKDSAVNFQKTQGGISG